MCVLFLEAILKVHEKISFNTKRLKSMHTEGFKIFGDAHFWISISKFLYWNTFSCWFRFSTLWSVLIPAKSILCYWNGPDFPSVSQGSISSCFPYVSESKFHSIVQIFLVQAHELHFSIACYFDGSYDFVFLSRF